MIQFLAAAVGVVADDVADDDAVVAVAEDVAVVAVAVVSWTEKSETVMDEKGRIKGLQA